MTTKTVPLPAKVQSALDRYVMGYAYARVHKVIAEALADAWEEGFLACQDERHQQNDNPYRMEHS